MELHLSPSSIKNWLAVHYQMLILSFVIACATFPAYDLTYGPGLDSSLPWVFNYFADGHFALGKNTLFPHGPLAFLLYPLPVGNNLVMCILITFICSFLLSWQMFRINLLRKNDHYVYTAVLLLLLHAFMEIQLMLIGLTLSSFILYHITNKKRHLLAALLFAVFNLYIKTYGGVISLLIVAGGFLNILFHQQNYKRLLLMAGGFILIFFGFWLALYHTTSGSLNFLYGQLQLSSDNSEAVAFYPDNNWLLIGICLLAILAIPFFIADRLSQYTFWVMLLPLFAAWKHAMARADNSHASGFLSFILFFSLFLWLVGSEKKIGVLVLCIVSICAFTLQLAKSGYNTKEKSLAVFKPLNFIDLATEYKKISESKIAESNDYAREKILPDTILSLIGKKTVDIYPWNYTIIAANHLNWQPRPVIHSYAAYTSWLDEQNAQHIATGHSAQFVIWEITQQLYEKLQLLQSIDDRYLLNDQPKAIIQFFSNYSLRFKNKDYMVYEKLPARADVAYSEVAKPRQVRYDSWIDVPPPAPNAVTRAKISIQKNWTGILKSIFYKGEAFTISYLLSDNSSYSHKIVPKNAADGVWIDPLVMNPESDFIEASVKKIKLNCNEPSMVDSVFTLAFERIQFSYDKQDTSRTQFLDNCFQKHEHLPALKEKLFEASNMVESNTGNWAENAEAARFDSASASAPYSYVLYPGKSSGSFTVSVDALPLKKEMNTLRLFVQAKIKTSKTSKARFVVTGNDERQYASANIKDFIYDENSLGWHPFYFSVKVRLNTLSPGEVLRFYFRNLDATHRMHVDDLSVRIEGEED